MRAAFSPQAFSIHRILSHLASGSGRRLRAQFVIGTLRNEHDWLRGRRTSIRGGHDSLVHHDWAVFSRQPAVFSRGGLPLIRI